VKKLLLAASCLFIAFNAANATPCEEVIAMIAEKIKANGVVSFTLEAVDKGTETGKKVVGVCGEGTKDIVYQRGSAAYVAPNESMPAKTADDPETIEVK
jgi:hypothetical protein